MSSAAAEFREVVERLLRSLERDGRTLEYDPRAWAQLSDLGLFGLAASGGPGGMADAVAILGAIGTVGLIGPYPEAMMAADVLPDDDLASLVAGTLVPTVTWNETMVPWGPIADLVLYFQPGGAVSICRVETAAPPVRTLTGDAWMPAQIRPGRPLGIRPRAVAIGELSVAAYVVGASMRALELAASYARDRTQFGQPIAQFQAVTHPLARHWSRLAAARDLTEAAASTLDIEGGRNGAVVMCARARLCATEAANQAVYSALQAHGGMGFVEGTEVTRLARRVRQVSLMAVPLAESEATVRAAIEPVEPAPPD